MFFVFFLLDGMLYYYTIKSKELSTTSTSSFRPVAVLNTTSKLVKSGQLNPSAHAYRKDHNTTMTLMEVLDELHQGIEDKKMGSIMTIDQYAAFDSVCHDLMIQKMQRYNIGESALQWFKDYLSYRTQYVTIGKASSTMDYIRTGVPQGSVIGPLMFAIYTNEMSLAVRNLGCQETVHQDNSTLFGQQCSTCGILSTFADYSTYTVTSNQRQSNQTSLLRSLDELECFLNNNKLVINFSKTSITECMIAQKKGKTTGTPPSLVVRGEDGEDDLVANKDYTRILGANLQANLSWIRHLETGKKAILPQVRKQLGLLKHQGKLIPRHCRLNLARGLVISKLCYIMPLWGGAAPANIKKAQVVMNSAARWATGLPKRTRITTLMARAGLSTMVQAWKLVYLKTPRRLLERTTITDDLKLEVQTPRLQFS